MRRWLLLAVVVLAACGGAPALTARGVATPRGGAWTATAVRRALARASATEARQ